MPVICSRMTRLIGVDALLHDRNSGRIRDDDQPDADASRTGTTTTSSDDSGTSWRSARMMPPTHMIGAAIISVNVMQHQHLDLLDVVGGSGDQRRRAELADLPGGEGLDLDEDRAAQVAAERHRRAGAEVDRGDRARRSAPA